MQLLSSLILYELICIELEWSCTIHNHCMTTTTELLYDHNNV